MKRSENYQLYSFYRFKKISNKIEIKNKLDRYIFKKCLKGTILIAEEGINGSVSGNIKELDKLLTIIRKTLNIRKLSLKKNNINFLPFNKMKIRLKTEIVSIGFEGLIKKKYKNNYIHPKDWDKFINNKNVKLIDVRNEYEILIGRFNLSINPNTKSFRNFPNKFPELGIKKNDKIAMYCTGGIRCEKASSYLQSKGFTKVYQLEGGILNYLEHNKKQLNSSWQGECFVFDKRVTVNRNLTQGKYLQCYGCRSPITEEMTFSVKYKKGVHCPLCFFERSNKQKANSTMRQKQIERKKISQV
ncbi:rhodanese-related sulfurtransferase [Pelagibacteraceae bacterium]|nr:rhodanese-related sulfurtransferase [Pelagibacteraceae bacterium]